MKETPIPMSGPMVPPTLSGAKTQTRRILNPQPGGTDPLLGPDGMWEWNSFANRENNGPRQCPYGKPGDQLWVKEAYYQFGHWDPITGDKARTRKGRQRWKFVADNSQVVFDAPDEFRKGRHHKDPATPAWHKRLARFMPRKYSRIKLEIVEIRVQRLQDITEADALAEGIYTDNVIVGAENYGGIHHEITDDRYFFEGCPDDGFENAIDAYLALWDSINGPGSSDLNPWVWAITFKRI